MAINISISPTVLKIITVGFRRIFLFFLGKVTARLLFIDSPLDFNLSLLFISDPGVYVGVQNIHNQVCGYK
jgi:hypothetical protein